MDPEGLGPDGQEFDELSHRRAKRLADRRNQFVPGLRGITFGQLADRAAAPTTEAPDAGKVTEFLRSRGHSEQTVETVLGCLGLDPAPLPVPNPAVGSLAGSRAGRRRLQALAEIEAMLLKD